MDSSWRYLPVAESSRLTKTFWLLPFVALAIGAGLRLPAPLYLKYLALLLTALAGTMTVLVIHRFSILPLSFLIVTSVLLPFNVIDNAGARISSSFAMLAVLLAVFALETAGNERAIIPVPRRVAIALFMFLGVAPCRSSSDSFPWFSIHGAPLSAQLAGLAIFLLSGGAFLLFATRLNSRRQIESITWVFLAAGGVTILLQLLPRIDEMLAFAPGVDRADGPFPHRQYVLDLAGCNGSRPGVHEQPTASGRPRWRCVLVIVLVLFHALVLNTGWTSGWLPALIALGIILLLKFPRLTISLGLFALPIVLFSTGIFDSFWNSEGYSFSTRVAAWQVLGSVLGRSPSDRARTRQLLLLHLALPDSGLVRDLQFPQQLHRSHRPNRPRRLRAVLVVHDRDGIPDCRDLAKGQPRIRSWLHIGSTGRPGRPAWLPACSETG